VNVVLYEPEIPWNTGNIGRTCVATATTLHLVGRLGFDLSDQQIRRSGLDYWPRLKLVRHADFEAFAASLPPRASVLVFTTRGPRTFWQAPYRRDSYLLFGRESIGLPESILRRFRGRLFRIPIGPEVRSLNLSSAVGIALYEGLRRTRPRNISVTRG
jgi:tRNA (cytidine/uridine-2'-O-)-methyltransferase